ncbi:MAG: NAD/NADP octopine/nopaline dehydrogenase family protein [Rhodoplanes sp.]|uniref:NAD/NADP-dependent octopine/nopaline dehydrogenase family protein n=1 Tax=Rhodoplanes sp. TaxID=1968906 RepID=UPI0017C162D7|nr:NAD/NADP-dependent octopine/nopaline dehydrogenase family protein [Rhodoplanes sp.]NVO17572.1 NAD/NADP octopine/nopaline dehydrogenase family protein [Rhodoplanes sp.]
MTAVRGDKVAILGAGAIGLATAAVLADRGHRPAVWSPRGRSLVGMPPTSPLAATGALDGSWEITCAADLPTALSSADTIILALDANGHADVMDAVAPLLQPGTTVIIEAAHSLGAVYLSRLLHDRGIRLPVVSWSTAIATAHRTGPLTVDIRTIRPRIDAAVMPGDMRDAGIATCRTLFGDRFATRTDALAIALLSNCNPIFHVPVCLLNVSRVEHGETWAPYGHTTPSVGRLMEALDRERIAIGAAFGHEIHSVNEHFHRSFRIPLGSMAEMNATLFAAGRGPRGPRDIAHRYFAQDISYGLVFAAAMARSAGIAAPLHEATIDLASAALGRDFTADNTLIPLLGLQGLDRDDVLKRASEGYFPTTSQGNERPLP